MSPSIIRQIPAILLSLEFLLGGIGRLGPVPFPALHARVTAKNQCIAPLLYPLIPFKDVERHNLWAGAWMCFTGLLLAVPGTRGTTGTLGLVLFWTGAGAWSQKRAGMPFWLPMVNAGLGGVVWGVERGML
ncbi:Hypothetical protein D9617_10g073200 [Elsinoe fawcettii]|nr:Hypothetical protein D9617_10g073200 [Elsinoe fawcettii]